MTTTLKKERKSRRKPTAKKATSKKAAGRLQIDPDRIVGRAMLVSANVRFCEFRKHDVEVTRDTNERHKASHDAGRYHKKLLGGKVTELNALSNYRDQIRVMHYEQTLPWGDDGWRLLPSANYFDYTKKMRDLMRKFDSAADEFETAYPKLIQKAADKLGDMFNREEYPSTATIRARFGATIEFSPLPMTNDFRLTDLPKDEIESIKKVMEERMRKAIEDAYYRTDGKEAERSGAWRRLGAAVMKVRRRLDDGKGLRQSWFDALPEVVSLLQKLNVVGDEALDEACKAVLDNLSKFDAKQLRDDDTMRKEAAARADTILESMAAFYSPSVDDKTEEDE